MGRTTFSEEERAFIEENYTLGAIFCAEHLNSTPRKVSSYANSRGLKVSKQVRSDEARKHASRARPELCKVNAESFINVTSPEHAYILGFLWADGYVSKMQGNGKYVICFNISWSDYEELASVFAATGQWNVRKHIPKPKHDTNRKPQAQIKISNKLLHQHLASLGYQSKSFMSPEQALKAIPGHLIHYWWRGYFDGDGCFFSSSKRCQYRLQIASSYDQDWSYHLSWMSELGVRATIRRAACKTGKSSSLICYGREDVLIFGMFLYDPIYDNIGLKRKFQDYINIKKSPRRYKSTHPLLAQE